MHAAMCSLLVMVPIGRALLAVLLHARDRHGIVVFHFDFDVALADSGKVAAQHELVVLLHQIGENPQRFVPPGMSVGSGDAAVKRISERGAKEWIRKGTSKIGGSGLPRSQHF